MNKTIPFAAGFAALALAGSSLAGGTTAGASAGGTSSPRVPAPRAQVAKCAGGPVTAMSSRAMDYQTIAAGATVEVEGSQWPVKGPKKGTDTVLVTLSSMASSGGAGELTSIAFYRDGVRSGEGSKYLAFNGPLDQGSVQFCTKIGKGQHVLALRVTDSGGSASTLYYPTITYQRFS